MKSVEINLSNISLKLINNLDCKNLKRKNIKNMDRFMNVVEMSM